MNLKRRSFYFLGVTTKSSAMVQILPLWADHLKLDLALKCVDMPIGTAPEVFRHWVADLRTDLTAVGAVVTTHKTDLFRAASDMFDEHDELALLCQEIGSIVIDNGVLFGSASIDVAGAGSTLRHILGETYFQESDADVLCLGSGGAGKAVVASLLNDLNGNHLIARNDKPKNIFVVDVDNSRLEDLQRLLNQIPGQTNTIVIHNALASRNDEILKQLSPRSLVVNASGLGKDRPGSPLTDEAVFPTGGIAWELNYRGERKFLIQAHCKQQQSELRIFDGWSLFLHNWSKGISRALKLEISESTKKELFEIASRFNPTQSAPADQPK